jgi:hypothetical protein
LNEPLITPRIFEIDDGDTLPITVIVDADGFHITQQDNMGLEDHISLSWTHLMGLFELTDKLESMIHVRH